MPKYSPIPELFSLTLSAPTQTKTPDFKSAFRSGNCLKAVIPSNFSVSITAFKTASSKSNSLPRFSQNALPVRNLIPRKNLSYSKQFKFIPAAGNPHSNAAGKSLTRLRNKPKSFPRNNPRLLPNYNPIANLQRLQKSPKASPRRRSAVKSAKSPSAIPNPLKNTAVQYFTVLKSKLLSSKYPQSISSACHLKDSAEALAETTPRFLTLTLPAEKLSTSEVSSPINKDTANAPAARTNWSRISTREISLFNLFSSSKRAITHISLSNFSALASKFSFIKSFALSKISKSISIKISNPPH
ncbi:MAG: hypothetical protein RR227_01780 [Oscillospiraceae bacterium]